MELDVTFSGICLEVGRSVSETKSGHDLLEDLMVMEEAQGKIEPNGKCEQPMVFIPLQGLGYGR